MRTRRRVITVILLSLLATPALSDDMYKWVDRDGNISYTNNPALIPQDQREEAETIERKLPDPDQGGHLTVLERSPAPGKSEEETSLSELEKERQGEQALRQFWRSRALEVESREKAILEEINILKREIEDKKREIDYLLINGYFADYSIRELRYLENYLQELNSQMLLLSEAKENLSDEARKQRIPPGYLRP